MSHVVFFAVYVIYDAHHAMYVFYAVSQAQFEAYLLLPALL